MSKRKSETEVPNLQSKKIELPKCSKCGVQSSSLSTTWPGPEFKPMSTPDKWEIDWAPSGQPTLDNNCVVCATIDSVLFDVGNKNDCNFEPGGFSIEFETSGQSLSVKLSSVRMNRKTWRKDKREETQRTVDNHIEIKPLVNTSSVVLWPSPWDRARDSFPTNSESDEAFDLANKWLDFCRKGHSNCASSTSFTPTRILDVGGKDLKLVLEKELQGTVEYVALSHCWGGIEPLITTRENLQSHRNVIPYGTLPKTFQDAVKVTKKLGLQYIWIDSLCIIQHDAVDWQGESGKMEQVYGHAELVLAGTAASSPEQGFLGNRSGSLSGQVTVELEPQMAPVTSAYKLSMEASHIVGVDGPLEGRAWAFQERLLAKRYLAYGVDEMRWTCDEGSWCDCEWSLAPTVTYNYGRNIDKILQDGFRRGSISKNSWAKDIVEPYTQREVTYSSDRLVALSALASQFHSKHPALPSQFQARKYANHYGTYLAGLWLEDLNYLLTWVAESGKPQDSYAPSWSWVSVDASVSYPAEFNHISDLAKVLEASTSKSSSINPFGSVSSGWIKLKGKVIKAGMHVSKNYACVDIANTKHLPCQLDMPVVAFNFPLDLATGQTERSARRAYHSEKELDHCAMYSVWLLPVLSQMSDTYVLVLGRSPKDRNCYERLGIVLFRDGGTAFESAWGGDGVEEFLSKYQDSEVTIV